MIPEIEQILVAMEIYGGSFVKQLARLYRLGDFENREKIVKAWPNYFSQYSKMAASIKDDK